MKMNCKQGDRAVMVRGVGAGTIVVCLELIPVYVAVWRVELLSAAAVREEDAKGSPFNRRPAGHRCCVADSSLRPLRDSDEEDEMLRIVGLPAGTQEAVNSN